MKIEIERKFLIANDGWRSGVVAVEELQDGLVGEFDGGKLRVRLAEARATLTIKTPRIGIRRTEFEYEIARPDAEAMLLLLCDDRIIQKTRYHVVHCGFAWSVDVYKNDLSGIALAEIELEYEDQPFPMPDWVGREVSEDPRFRKRTIHRLSRDNTRPLSIADLLALPL